MRGMPCRAIFPDPTRTQNRNVFTRLIESLVGGDNRPARPASHSRGDLEGKLALLETEANVPAADFRAAVLGRAGDLCLEAGETSRAVSYYGRAVDGYLTAGYYDSAMALCQKMITISPGIVRARCTMAFLLLGADLPFLKSRGVSERVREHLQGYANAARNAGNGDIAIQRLKMMAGVTDVETVRQLIGDILFDLGASDDAADLHYALFEERAIPSEDEVDPNEQRRRWAELLRVTIMDQ